MSAPAGTRARRAAEALGPEADVAALPGVTPPRREAFERLGIRTVEDLLRLAPRRYEDRRHPTPIGSLAAGEPALVLARVLSSKAIRLRGGLSLRTADVEDASGRIEVRWFHRGFLAQPLRVGARVALYGVPRRSRGRIALVGPACETIADDLPEGVLEESAAAPAGGRPRTTGRLVPVHPLTPGLSAPIVRRAAWAATAVADRVADGVPAGLAARWGLPPLGEALRDLHFPETEPAAERARSRLAFEELVVHALMLARRRAARGGARALPFRFTPRLDERIRARLPFTLTPAQDGAVAEVARDLAGSHPMCRLLQGDVGSGKTAVAAYALLAAAANRVQAALLAPTAVLAEQHRDVFGRLLEGSRVRVESLVGGRRTAERRAALARIAAGDADLVLGTHAVLSEDVRFRRLGLVVVDEQHRFGVRQRRDLVAKGDAPHRPHCLVMTATPIPRTLALAVYGDLDVSVIEGRPPGRGRVETWVVRPTEGARVLDRVKREVAAGRQAFVIYPLIEESDRSGLRDATLGRERWARALPARRVGLLHGRMTPAEKSQAMADFRSGALDVLVATVVVEVGIDVPNATVLIVEHAERFGLSQLHQLRGRVGRGGEDGLCALVDRSKDGGAERLEVLARTDDGFEVAEADLRLRGGGDLFGTRQHGAPAFRAAEFPRDLPWLARAREAAHALLAEDPTLARPGHAALLAQVVLRERESIDPSLGG